MPELPEVEVVRLGLSDHVVGREMTGIEVLDARSLRRHAAGPADFVERTRGRRVLRARRRGKYLWLVLDDGAALVVHLGMSGQALVADPDTALHRHTRIVFDLDDGRQWRFVDQRIFGGMLLSELDEAQVPVVIGHIALDPLDPQFDLEDTLRRLKLKDTGIKRALLDQTLVSGVGNIYADEALWRARLHGERSTRTMTRPVARELFGHVADVMREALAQGGTSFDALYVNVNGESGYFDRSLDAYGREGEPCHRCGSTMKRIPFAGRSSTFCPKCQRRR